MRKKLNLAEAYVSILALLSLVFLLAVMFIAFRFLSNSDKARTRQYITSILRRESANADTYELGKNLQDLESVGLVNCIVLSRYGNERAILFKSAMSDRCHNFLATREKSLFYGLSGQSYSVEYSIPPKTLSLLFEVLVYLIIIAAAFFILRLIQKQRIQAELKLRAIQIEKDLIAQSARQATHDIASPLTAIQAIVAAVPNLDPIIKQILCEATRRTKAIFDDLQICGAPSAQPLFPVLARILQEKAIEFESRSAINTDMAGLDESRKAVFNEFHFYRVISNIINNSYEAFLNNRDQSAGACSINVKVISSSDLIRISIQDNGPGFHPEYLSSFGQRGLSFGKPQRLSSGGGMGLSHAKINIEAWGGRLEARNNELGALVEIELRQP